MAYSKDDAQKPTALAKIYLEDGTVLTGISFGSHTSAEGEVSLSNNNLSSYTTIINVFKKSPLLTEHPLYLSILHNTTIIVIIIHIIGRVRNWYGWIS